MKILTTKIVVLLALLISINTYGQVPLLPVDELPDDDCVSCGTVSVNLVGATNVNLNGTYSYSVSVSSGLHGSSTYTVSGGQIISQSKTAVSVKWTSTGSKYVRVTAIVNRKSYLATKYVNVSAPLTGGGVSASTSTTFCSGGDPGIINNSQSPTGGSGSYSYQWQMMNEGGLVPESESGPSLSWLNVSGATSSSYNPPVLTTSRIYRRKVTSGSAVAYSNSVSYSIAAAVNKGSISYSGGAINPGSQPAKITGTTATGGDGIAYRWQWKRGTESSFTNIPTNLGSSVTSRDYQPQALDKNTVFRRRVNSCGKNYYTNQVTISVNLKPGSISGSQTICSGGDPSNISSTALASGGNGSYSYRWQRREYKPLTLPSEPTPIGEEPISSGTEYAWTGWSEVASGTSYNPGVQTFKTQYRRKVTSNGSTKYSNVITKNIYASADPGTISYSGGNVNPGGTPNQLTGTVATGGSSISYQWQKKTTGGYTNITGATNQNYQSGSLTRTTTFKRIATTNCGSTAASNAIKITVNLTPGSIASGSETICRDTDPAVIASNSGANGGVGSYQYQWQMFSDLVLIEEGPIDGPSAEEGWTDITGETNLTFDPPLLNLNRTYRRKVTSGTQTAYTASKTYTVTAIVKKGSISYSGGAINPGSQPAKITGTTATGGDGIAYRWQWKRGTESSFSHIPSNLGSSVTSRDYQPQALDKNTVFRRRVRSCSKNYYSNWKTIIVNLKPGSIAGDQIICPGGDPTDISNTSIATGGNGDYDYKWQKREYRPATIKELEEPVEEGEPTGPVNPEIIYAWTGWEDITGEAGLSLNPDNQSFNTQYRRSVTSAGTTKYSNAVTVNLVDLSDAGIISYAGGTINVGQIPTTITGTSVASNETFTYQWQQKIGSVFTDISGETGVNFIPQDPLTTSTYFKRLVRNDCGIELSSNTVKVRVRLISGEITTDAVTICHGCSSPIINATDPQGGTGSYSYQWQIFTPLIKEGDPQPLEDGYTDILENGNDASLSSRPIYFNSTFRREVTSDGQTVYTGPITISVYPILNAGTITYSSKVCENNSPNLINGTAASGGNNSYEYQWQYYNGAQWVQLVRGSQYQNYDPSLQLTANTKFRRRVRSAGSTWKSSNQLTIELHDLATSTGPLSAPADKVCPGGQVRFTFSPESIINTNKTYLQVYRDNKWTNVGKIQSALNVKVLEDDKYRVKYDQPCNGDIFSNVVILNFLENCNLPPSLDQNFVRTEIASIPMSSELTLSKANNYQKLTNYSYLDGLGREVMNVSVEAVEDQEDLIQYIYYDENTGENTISYLPYAKSAQLPGEFQSNPISDLQDFYGGTDNVAVDERFFSETITEPSPLNRPKETIGAGKGWKTADAKMEVKHLLYNATGNEVLPKWRLKSGGYPERDGVHAAKTLNIEEVIDEEGVKSQVLIDMRGRKIAERVWNEGEWFTTYYAYDLLDRLRVVLPPEIATVASTTNTEVNKYGFLYKYDEYGRVIEKRLPGQKDWHYLVYDKWDRLVLTQDPNLRKDDKWLFTKYDELNRPIMTGLLTSSIDVAQLRSNLGGGVSYARFDTYNGTGVEGYNNASYPAINSSTKVLTVTYYDNYSYLAQSEWTGMFDFKNAGIEASHGGHSYTYPSSRDNRVKGMITGSKTKNLSTDEWLKESNFYDHKARLIQSTTANENGGFNRISHLLDYGNKILASRITHKKASSGSVVNIYRRLAYDQTGKLLAVYHKLDDNEEVQIALNEYNGLGQIVGKNLHYDSSEDDFAQSIDYKYNIRGWLTGINDSNLSDGENDLFGLDIHYNTNAGLTGQNTLFDGNISAMRWSSFNDSDTRSYAYAYDGLKRIKDASHFSGGAAINDYSLKNILYDKNGNISNLTRYGSSAAIIDELTYRYKGNQLKYVEDTKGAEGFDNKHVGSESDWDYLYDDNGNQTKDRNKQIATISYNFLNLPERVDFENGDYLLFAYNANGEKLRQEVYEGGSLSKKKEYLGSFYYENDDLKFIKHSEGRITFTSDDDPNYQYYLKDHLGNTRLTFSTTPEIYEMKETFENENGLFIDLHRQTNEAANTTPGGNQVGLLESMQTGALGLVSVNKGDKVSLSVNANYLTEPDGNSLARTAYDALFGTFDAGYGSGAESGGVSGATSGAFDDALLSSGMTGKDAVNEAPRAFLNFIFFDKDMKFEYAGFKQISTAAFGSGNQETVTIPEFEIEKDGYILGYLSNENFEAVGIHFDDFIIHQDKVNVLFASDYYPFGLQFNEFTRTASEKMRYKFQGQEHDQKTGWVQFKWRNHQPELGRFFNVDPLAEQYSYQSPYNFSENMVTAHVELEGKEAKYFMIDFNSANPQLELYKTVDYWLIPNSMEPDIISVEVLGPNLSYTFSVAGSGGDPYCAGCGSGNNLDQFESFAKNPLAAVYSNEYVTDQEIMSDAAKDLIVSIVLARTMRTSVPRRGTPSMTMANRTKGWKVGDPINNLTNKGNVPSWSTVRQRHWKNRANNAQSGEFSDTNLSRMKKGLAPQRYNPETGKMESMELDHKPPQRDGGLFDFEEVWPDEHAAQDPFRHTGN
ncbi:DUF6443 domain-containing protein [Ekhidna sp.]|uniref:DUF6443 domain-containing protein n=1 Tax=Ekhidna sp. TaxID=2608089 RepID=UPI003297C6B3